jgi:hypothetical protein
MRKNTTQMTHEQVFVVDTLCAREKELADLAKGIAKLKQAKEAIDGKMRRLYARRSALEGRVAKPAFAKVAVCPACGLTAHKSEFLSWKRKWEEQ